MQTRRDLLTGLGVTATAALAGCPGGLTDSTNGETVTDGEGSQADVGAATAVATEWTVYRARVYDAVALGRAGQASAGAAVAESIFARFEDASGEYGAHEMLEETSESAYEGFEGGLEDLHSALEAGDVDGDADAAATASGKLQVAQQAVAGTETTRALDLLWLASRGANAAFLADAGAFEAAETVAHEAYETFEDALVHGALEDADHDTYESFEHGLEDASEAASSHDAETVSEHVDAALAAAVDGAYTLATGDAAAGAGHLAAMQARGYDAAALAGLGGPGESFAHAAALNVYRARAHDARWLAAEADGAGDARATAATMAGDIYAHFEEARAHEAIEHADHEAYEASSTASKTSRLPSRATTRRLLTTHSAPSTRTS